MSRPVIVLYGRPGCCLCDAALDVVRRVSRDIPLELEQRDITEDDALHLAYLERIPVITIDGEEALELEIREDELRKRLTQADL
ncbi:MAG: glutaredoxin family protein [Solirubrobacteraceae bacterium]